MNVISEYARIISNAQNEVEVEAWASRLTGEAKSILARHFAASASTTPISEDEIDNLIRHLPHQHIPIREYFEFLVMIYCWWTPAEIKQFKHDVEMIELGRKFEREVQEYQRGIPV